MSPAGLQDSVFGSEASPGRDEQIGQHVRKILRKLTKLLVQKRSR